MADGEGRGQERTLGTGKPAVDRQSWDDLAAPMNSPMPSRLLPCHQLARRGSMRGLGSAVPTPVRPHAQLQGLHGAFSQGLSQDRDSSSRSEVICWTLDYDL